MADTPTYVEFTAAAQDVDAAIARECAGLGVARDAVMVQVLEEANGQVRLRLTVTSPAGAPADEADDHALSVTREALRELLSRMKVRADVEARWGEAEAADDPQPLFLDVHGDDLSLLIGRKGETLAALQYLTRLIASKELGSGVNVFVDVEGYRQRREEQLRRMARRMAEQVVQRQRTMMLEPMTAAERRIIHLELRDHPDVRTESVGEGERRKVTIVPKADR